MIENTINRLASTATDCVRWPVANSFSPDLLELSASDLYGINDDVTLTSLPVAVNGMELHTFQIVYEVDPLETSKGFGVTPHFQVSQDGRHWDDLPDDSFTVNLGTIIVGRVDNLSATIEVLSKSNYIRMTLHGRSIEGTPPNAGDKVKVYITSTEG